MLFNASHLIETPNCIEQVRNKQKKCFRYYSISNSTTLVLVEQGTCNTNFACSLKRWTKSKNQPENLRLRMDNPTKKQKRQDLKTTNLVKTGPSRV